MSTVTLAELHDEKFLKERQKMLMYPVLVLPLLVFFFWSQDGGKGERYLEQEAAAKKPGGTGFNAIMPMAKSGTIAEKETVEPTYAQASHGQTLSSFTSSRRDSSMRVTHAVAVTTQPVAEEAAHKSSMAGSTVMVAHRVNSVTTHRNAAALAATQGSKRTPYYYNAPKNSAYYAGTDRQIESQLRTYEEQRNAPAAPVRPVQTDLPEMQSNAGVSQPAERTATVRFGDNLTASRLSDAGTGGSAFNTITAEDARQQPRQALVSGDNGRGGKRAVTLMIPVVVHDDQTVKSGNTVKLRLLKDITVDGIAIPANTILHAICQSGDDRLRLVVNSLQIDGQLIALDLEAYDLDGSAGVNMPGISNQAGGQVRSSALQGVQLPGVGSLVSSVASAVRNSASQSVRQTSVRLRGGYKLYLKAQ